MSEKLAHIELFLRHYGKAAARSQVAGLAEWMLEHGTRLTSHSPSADHPYLAEWVGDHDPQVGQCYYNAQKITVANREIEYCEGWYLTSASICPSQHAWNAAGDHYYDVTVEALSKFFRDSFKQEAEVAWLGVRVSRKLVLKCWKETGYYRDVLPLAWARDWGKDFFRKNPKSVETFHTSA